MRLHEAIKEFIELKKVKGIRSSKTAARYECTLRIFCLCMQDPLLEDIELSHIIWYLKELERLGWKPNGINLVGLALKKLFEFCNLRKYPVSFNEILIPLKEKTFSVPRITGFETFKQLLKQIPSDTNHPHHIRNKAILLMLWDTGVRAGELMSLDISDLDLKNKMALIKTEKSRGRRPVRQIFWTSETNVHLLRWLEKLKELKGKFNFADTDALFVSISKSPQQSLRGCRMNPRGVAEVMRVLSNQAGLPTVANAHGIRHSMGRDTVKTLRSNSAVSNILGHSNIESSYVYTMLFGDELKEQWSEVMKKRGHPLAAPPRRAAAFPKLKNEPASVIKGQIRPVKIKTSSTARWLRS
jgi:site-specific recombinase XerD